MNRTLNAVSTSLATLLLLVAASGVQSQRLPRCRGGRRRQINHQGQLHPARADGRIRRHSAHGEHGVVHGHGRLDPEPQRQPGRHVRQHERDRRPGVGRSLHARRHVRRGQGQRDGAHQCHGGAVGHDGPHGRRHRRARWRFRRLQAHGSSSRRVRRRSRSDHRQRRVDLQRHPHDDRQLAPQRQRRRDRLLRRRRQADGNGQDRSGHGHLRGGVDIPSRSRPISAAARPCWATAPLPSAARPATATSSSRRPDADAQGKMIPPGLVFSPGSGPASASTPEGRSPPGAVGIGIES